MHDPTSLLDTVRRLMVEIENGELDEYFYLMKLVEVFNTLDSECKKGNLPKDWGRVDMQKQCQYYDEAGRCDEVAKYVIRYDNDVASGRAFTCIDHCAAMERDTAGLVSIEELKCSKN